MTTWVGGNNSVLACANPAQARATWPRSPACSLTTARVEGPDRASSQRRLFRLHPATAGSAPPAGVPAHARAGAGQGAPLALAIGRQRPGVPLVEGTAARQVGHCCA